jgi:hypothetical protein
MGYVNQDRQFVVADICVSRIVMRTEQPALPIGMHFCPELKFA